MSDVFNPAGRDSFGSPFYGLNLFKQQRAPKKVELIPFQKENLSTNQQAVPLPYVRGTRLVAVRWITPALNHITQPAPKSGGKKG